MLKDDEQLFDLQGDNLKIIQKKSGFKFGTDSVLVSNYAKVKKGGTIVDFGTGSGIIALLLSVKTTAVKIYGIEIQTEMAKMACRSVEMNKLNNKISIIEGDIKDARSIFGKNSVDAVVTNPPYKEYGTGLKNQDEAETISRHEVTCKLQDIIKSASEILKPNGYFTMIHRPSRIADIIECMRIYKIEPKHIRFVHPYPGKKPNMVLVGGTYLGRKFLEIGEPLYIMDKKGDYTKEIVDMYDNNFCCDGGLYE